MSVDLMGSKSPVTLCPCVGHSEAFRGSQPPGLKPLPLPPVLEPEMLCLSHPPAKRLGGATCPPLRTVGPEPHGVGRMAPKWACLLSLWSMNR